MPTTTALVPPTTDDERQAWIALAAIPGVGPRRMAGLIGTFGSASGVLRAPLAALEGAGLPRNVGEAVRGSARQEGDRLVRSAERAGQVMLTPSDAAYPALLRAIPDPPLLLFVVGDARYLNMPAVAIVGSREHTAYGESVARTMGAAAGMHGIVVVSGMARGLDAVAQAAALETGGVTIGVLGHGADIVYPAQNRALYDRVRSHGVLLSETPPGERPNEGSFPRRNRLISGLSRALVVVEAADKSGTMITVSCALEQGRDVLAVPGPITSPTSQGTNRLLREGATPLLSTDDLLAHFGVDPAVPAPVPVPCTLSPTEARVLGALQHDPVHVDALALAAGLPVGELLGVLLGLELAGLASAGHGGTYRRR